MLDEFLLRRPPAPRPYNLSSAKLTVSPSAVQATHDLLQRAGRSEACIFWYGERECEMSRVCSVRAPVQTSSFGHYHIEPEDLSQMVRDLPDHWRPLAQIHCHPGRNTEHSRYDDLMVSSRKMLSIVFPNFGAHNASWPAGLGVHEWQIDYWHMLTPPQVRARLCLHDIGDLEIRDFR